MIDPMGVLTFFQTRRDREKDHGPVTVSHAFKAARLFEPLQGHGAAQFGASVAGVPVRTLDCVTISLKNSGPRDISAPFRVEFLLRSEILGCGLGDHNRGASGLSAFERLLGTEKLEACRYAVDFPHLNLGESVFLHFLVRDFEGEPELDCATARVALKLQKKVKIVPEWPTTWLTRTPDPGSASETSVEEAEGENAPESIAVEEPKESIKADPSGEAPFDAKYLDRLTALVKQGAGVLFDGVERSGATIYSLRHAEFQELQEALELEFGSSFVNQLAPHGSPEDRVLAFFSGQQPNKDVIFVIETIFGAFEAAGEGMRPSQELPDPAAVVRKLVAQLNKLHEDHGLKYRYAPERAQRTPYADAAAPAHTATEVRLAAGPSDTALVQAATQCVEILDSMSFGLGTAKGVDLVTQVRDLEPHLNTVIRKANEHGLSRQRLQTAKDKLFSTVSFHRTYTGSAFDRASQGYDVGVAINELKKLLNRWLADLESNPTAPGGSVTSGQKSPLVIKQVEVLGAILSQFKEDVKKHQPKADDDGDFLIQ